MPAFRRKLRATGKSKAVSRNRTSTCVTRAMPLNSRGHCQVRLYRAVAAPAAAVLAVRRGRSAAILAE